MNETHDCPICWIRTHHEERYPNAVCMECADLISDKEGNPVRIEFNWSGGHSVVYTEKDARYFDEFVYIDGVKCSWQEDRFGRGVVIQKAENE